MDYELKWSDVNPLVCTINECGRRIAYEEFKKLYGVPFLEHEPYVFDIWCTLINNLEKRQVI
jgi:hypothetical protein